jgi:hypothetical protein
VLKLLALALVAVAAFVLWPRGDDEPAQPGQPDRGERAERPRGERRAPARLERPPCRDDVPDCASTSGRIVYVERVDPDGDGDLHVVVSDRRGVTLRGLTAVDVSKVLRPRRDPRIGDLAAAMGPVQRGSFGQSQIHALEFRTRRRR